MKINVGCSGWLYRHWKGLFYPKEITQKKWFEFYASKFDTVELNSPFYRIPEKKTVLQWRKNSPDNFIFTMKASRIITHIKRFNNADEWVKNFYKLCSLLDEKLGCILFQLPPSTKYSREKLDQIINSMDPDFTNAVEFRHVSWFNDEIYEKLSDEGIIFCTVSAPGFPVLLRPAKKIYLRFHGTWFWYASNYSSSSLAKWANAAKESKAKEIYAYFNNDVRAYAPKNAIEFAKHMEK